MCLHKSESCRWVLIQKPKETVIGLEPEIIGGPTGQRRAVYIHTIRSLNQFHIKAKLAAWQRRCWTRTHRSRASSPRSAKSRGATRSRGLSFSRFLRLSLFSVALCLSLSLSIFLSVYIYVRVGFRIRLLMIEESSLVSMCLLYEIRPCVFCCIDQFAVPELRLVELS